jgi:hypothetical protein
MNWTFEMPKWHLNDGYNREVAFCDFTGRILYGKYEWKY